MDKNDWVSFWFAPAKWLNHFLSTAHKNEHVINMQVKLFFQQLPSVAAASALTATVTYVLFYGKVDALDISIWLGSVYLVTLVRVITIWMYRKTTVLSSDSWASISVTLTLLSGIQWGAASFLMLNSQFVIDMAILIIIVVSLIAASMASLSVIPALFVVYAIPVGVSLVAALIITGNNELYLLSTLVVVFWLAMIFFSRNIYKTTLQGIRLSIENQELIKNLQLEKEKSDEASQAKSRFLAAASHDLRQPLQALTLFTEALKTGVKNEKNVSLVGRISKSLMALRGLLDSLLDISKLDAGGVEVNATGFDVALVLSEIRDEFKPMAEKKFQQLVVSNTTFNVFSDYILIKRIIQNLVVNAIKHSPEETLIIVDVEAANDKCIVTVKDNGMGISENESSKIYDEFYQQNNPERDRNKGLGLGLAIVKRLTNLLGVKLSLESQPASGCTFRLELPTAKPEQVTIKNKETRVTSVAQFKDMGVLVVEDEIDVRESLVMLLEGWGCDVWQSDNIAGALALARQHPVKLVISDYRLRNKETGLGLLKQLDVIEKDISGMLITGDTAVEKLKEFMHEDYLVLHKPIRPAELRVAIKQLTAEIV
ncbi:MAG: ATP-binding protein [Gammaproteobacteria bacterium]|nr:ATP-binding protein [Gammaproteobacteria bacterium]